jgi:hypothetical protein
MASADKGRNISQNTRPNVLFSGFEQVPYLARNGIPPQAHDGMAERRQQSAQGYSAFNNENQAIPVRNTPNLDLEFHMVTQKLKQAWLQKEHGSKDVPIISVAPLRAATREYNTKQAVYTEGEGHTEAIDIIMPVVSDEQEMAIQELFKDLHRRQSEQRSEHASNASSEKNMYSFTEPMIRSRDDSVRFSPAVEPKNNNVAMHPRSEFKNSPSAFPRHDTFLDRNPHALATSPPWATQNTTTSSLRPLDDSQNQNGVSYIHRGKAGSPSEEDAMQKMINSLTLEISDLHNDQSTSQDAIIATAERVALKEWKMLEDRAMQAEKRSREVEEELAKERALRKSAEQRASSAEYVMDWESDEVHDYIFVIDSQNRTSTDCSAECAMV